VGPSVIFVRLRAAAGAFSLLAAFSREASYVIIDFAVAVDVPVAKGST